jgi:hypothetical protein
MQGIATPEIQYRFDRVPSPTSGKVTLGIVKWKPQKPSRNSPDCYLLVSVETACAKYTSPYKHVTADFRLRGVHPSEKSKWTPGAKSKKHTTGGIPRWSPTLVLVARFSAYVWQSGRDAQFSLTYGRMYSSEYIVCYINYNVLGYHAAALTLSPRLCVFW